MLKGVEYLITLDNGLIQTIDFWTYLCEVQEDYEGWVYEWPYKRGIK